VSPLPAYSPGGGLNGFPLPLNPIGPTASPHRLRRGLPGYLILFAPHAFVPQRRLRYSHLPSQSVFWMISMHLTATPSVPVTSSSSKKSSICGKTPVKRVLFTADLPPSLRTL